MHVQLTEEWNKSKTNVFWGEIAPTDHVLQIYETDEAFLSTLAGFVGGGINAGDCVIVIATRSHLTSLERTLESMGVHVKSLIANNRYFPLDAEKTLAKFMVDGWPDEELFMKTVSQVLGNAKATNQRIRAFGEMVAILWDKGLNGATVQLENLWNKFCEHEEFCLYCAYPKSGFTGNMEDSIKDICCTHSKVISGTVTSMTEVHYKTA